MDYIVIEFNQDNPNFRFAIGLDDMYLANKTQFQIHLLLDAFLSISLFLTSLLYRL